MLLYSVLQNHCKHNPHGQDGECNERGFHQGLVVHKIIALAWRFNLVGFLGGDGQFVLVDGFHSLFGLGV